MVNKPKQKKQKDSLFFSILNNILYLKQIEQYNKDINNEKFNSEFNLFVILRYLSMSKDTNTVKYVFDNQISLERELTCLEKKIIYLQLLKTVPKQKQRIYYVKGN